MRHLDYPSCKTVNCWHSYSRWGRERVASAFAYKGGQYVSYASLEPMSALITQDARPEIVDAPLTLISRIGQGAFVYIFWSQRRPVHLTVGYLNGSINRTGRNAKPEIGPEGSCQTRRNPLVDGYGAGFGPPRISGSGIWTVLEPNRTVFPVQTRTAGGLPGPVANTRLSFGFMVFLWVYVFDLGISLYGMKVERCALHKGPGRSCSRTIQFSPPPPPPLSLAEGS